MRARLALLILLAAGAGCSTRDRVNPFDPANRTTAGRPVGFVALAGNRSVQLRWQSAQGDGLLGYQLFRRTAVEDTFQALAAPLPPATTQFVDRGLVNDLDHHYQLRYVFDRGLGEPASDVATPGARQPWLADAGDGSLARPTPDGRRIAERRAGLLSPSGIAVDSLSRHVWASDPGGGQVAVLDLDTGTFLTVPGFQTPGEIAAQTGDSTAWVCDEARGQVVHLDTQGVRRLPGIAGLQTPAGVAIDAADGSIWVCERNGDRVLRYDATVAVAASAIVSRPSRVAVDAGTGRAWVTSATGQVVVRIAPGGGVEETFGGFGAPVGIAIDARRGRIWVADPGLDRVLALRRDGSVEFAIGGLPGARSVCVDPETGEAWAALSASGEVARLSAPGAVVRRLGGLSTPYGIAIDP
jgi:DNA-binding beta-propeller fold protein YncE